MSKIDITEQLELKCVSASAFGFSVYDVWHDGERIGEIFCGVPDKFVEGFSFEIEKVNDKQDRLIVWKHPREIDDWNAAAKSFSA